MFRRSLLSASLVLGFCAQAAHASSDDNCYPAWTLTQSRYSCSNVAFLSPGNDNRVSLQLLLMDAGHGTLNSRLPSEDERNDGFGIVPFTVESFAAATDGPPPAEGETEPDSDSDSYADGDANRCQSSATGAGDFVAAITASQDVPEPERNALAAVRQNLPKTCDTPMGLQLPADIQSPTGQQFASYLTGATAFYEGDYDAALARFTSLQTSTQPWLKDVSRYMVARTQLNRAQHGAFNDEGYPDAEKLDKPALEAADQGFKDYLREFPEGRYALSAKGLLRRVYWLADKPQELAEEFEWQFSHPDSKLRTNSQSVLAQEAASKLLTYGPAQVHDPLLLATIDLMGMRKLSSYADPKTALSLADLQAQQPFFAGHEALYQYLVAAHYFYVQGKPAEALKNLPSDLPGHPVSYLEFSQQTLRGLALEAAGERETAAALWLKLLPLAQQPLQHQQVELALAINYEHGGKLAQLFAQNTPLTDVAIREILLRHDAGRDLLRQRIQAVDTKPQERSLALFVLLYKDLMRKRYADFIADYPLLPATVAAPVVAATDPAATSWLSPAYGKEPPLGLFRWAGSAGGAGYACPAVREIAQTLQGNPDDSQGLLCLGEFARLNALDAYPLDVGQEGQPTVLGTAPSQFTGPTFSRLDGYKRVIASAAATPAAKSYALYRAVNCYGPGGNNGCGGKDDEKNVRKAWFQKLKSQYGDTSWARSLKYYW
jgi:hypothetical protein